MGEGYYTSIMTGLISETTYFVRAYAASENDTIYGNELSFITQAALQQVILLPTRVMAMFIIMIQ